MSRVNNVISALPLEEKLALFKTASPRSQLALINHYRYNTEALIPDMISMSDWCSIIIHMDIRKVRPDDGVEIEIFDRTKQIIDYLIQNDPDYLILLAI